MDTPEREPLITPPGEDEEPASGAEPEDEEATGKEGAAPAAESAAASPDGEPAEQPRAWTDADLKAEVDRLLDQALSDETVLGPRVEKEIARREEQKQQEQTREERAQEFRGYMDAAAKGEDDEEGAQALIALGRLVFQQVRAAEQRAPIEEEIRTKAAAEHRQGLADSLDSAIEAAGLADAAAALYNSPPDVLAPLVMDNFRKADGSIDGKGWARAVMQAVRAKHEELAAPAQSEAEKATRRAATAEKVRAGTPAAALAAAGKAPDKAPGETKSVKSYLRERMQGEEDDEE